VAAVLLLRVIARGVRRLLGNGRASSAAGR
jgi:hypothetical protein